MRTRGEAAFPLLLSAALGPSVAALPKDILARIDDETGDAGTLASFACDDGRHPSDVPGIPISECRKFFRLWKHNHDALRRHFPDERFDGDIMMFEAAEQEDTRILDLLRIERVGKEIWRNHITGSLRTEVVPGDHYSMFRDSTNIACLADSWNRTFFQESAVSVAEGISP